MDTTSIFQPVVNKIFFIFVFTAYFHSSYSHASMAGCIGTIGHACIIQLYIEYEVLLNISMHRISHWRNVGSESATMEGGPSSDSAPNGELLIYVRLKPNDRDIELASVMHRKVLSAVSTKNSM